MTDTASSARHLAERLLSAEARHASDPSQIADAFERGCTKLTAQLARIVGELGAQAVLLRALSLTRARFPSLDNDPALEAGECLKAPLVLRGQDPAIAAEALTSLLGNILMVLLDLLGPNLVYRLLSAAWPEMEFP